MLRYRRLSCWLIFFCTLALSAIPVTEADEPAQSLATVASRWAALDQLIAERAGLQAGEETARVQINNRIAELYLKLRDLDSAFATITESLNLARQLEPSANGNLLVDTLNLCGFVNMRRHDYDDALTLLNEALGLSSNRAYKRGEAQARQYFAEVHFNLTQLDIAESYSTQALNLWRELQDQRGVADTLSNRGEIYARWDRPEQATAALLEAETLWRQLNEPIELATALINLNFVAVRQGQWQTALAFLNQAQPLLVDKQAEPYLAGQIAMAFGEAHEAYGQLPIALNYFRESLAHYDEGAHDLSATVDASTKVGRVLAQTGDFAGARQQIAQNLSKAELTNNDLLIGLCHEALGRVALAEGSYEQARMEFQAAITSFEKIDGERLLARAQSYLGQTEYLLGNQQQASTAYQKALKTFKKTADYTNEAALCFGIGKLALDREQSQRGERISRTLDRDHRTPA